MAKLEIKIPLSRSGQKTRERIERVATPPSDFNDPLLRAIQYLRNASFRAGVCLSAFYVYLGSELSRDENGGLTLHPDSINQFTLEWATEKAISLEVISKMLVQR